MKETLVTALISLPEMASDTALLAAVLAVAGAVAIAARSVLAWQGLAARTAAVRRRRLRIEQLEVGLHAELADVRAQLQRLNGDAERALWWLPRLDARLGQSSGTLIASRSTLERLARNEGRAMRMAFTRTRATLNMLRSARDVRRTILG